MFKRGIRTRLLVNFMTVIILALSVLGSYILWYYYRQNLDNLTANLQIHAQVTEKLLADQMAGPKETAAIDHIIKDLSKNIDLRFTIIDSNGLVLADSWENPLFMDNHRDRPEVAEALAGDSSTSIRYSSTMKENLLYVTRPIYRNGEIIGLVRVATSLASVEEGFSKIRSAIFAAFILTSLLAVGTSVRLARKFTQPLEEITAMAQYIAEGKLDKRIHLKTGDEIELLAHTLNNLAQNLDDKVNEIVEEKRKLELILRHMDNAVILFDKYGRILTVNSMAVTIFNIKENMLGQHNIQVVGNSALDRAVRDTIMKRESILIDLKTDMPGPKRAFQVFLAPVTDSDNDITGVLGVFHDITALQKIHERQVEFVANASHELATPLTAIKGFAETLLDGAIHDPELATKFVQIIHAEAERMHRLVQDLLQLAKLDSHDYRRQLKLESTPVLPLFATVTRELSPNWNRKNISVLIDETSEQLAVMANPDWLKQVLINLVDNGIKYTPAGGKVILKCLRQNNEAVIMVIDTGIGIPDKDLPLIFDRFYRVDRARVRTAGGTGLGLAIVKFIVEILGGKIDVKSQVDKGTTFSFTLPLAQIGPK